MKPIEWMMGPDTGISSKTICAVMTGCDTTGIWCDVPHDPADFGRCYRLLKSFPEWRGFMYQVAERFKEWGPLVAAWDELTALYEEELPTGKGKAPKLYARMQTLIDEGKIAAGWKRVGTSGWIGPRGAASVTIKHDD